MQLKRREMLIAAGALGAAAVGGGDALAQFRRGAGAANQGAQEVKSEEPNSPPEYMMLDHAIIERMLLVYEECVRRLKAREALPAGALAAAVGVVRQMGEDYHAKREDATIFAYMVNHAESANLLKTLKAQHDAARAITDKLLAYVARDFSADAAAQQAVIGLCEAYIRMARPHMAREATDVFPTFYEVVPAATVDALSAYLAKFEQQTFGEDGYEKFLERLDAIEKPLGIHELERFTAMVR